MKFRLRIIPPSKRSNNNVLLVTPTVQNNSMDFTGTRPVPVRDGKWWCVRTNKYSTTLATCSVQYTVTGGWNHPCVARGEAFKYPRKTIDRKGLDPSQTFEINIDFGYYRVVLIRKDRERNCFTFLTLLVLHVVVWKVETSPIFLHYKTIRFRKTNEKISI